jgi:16S rRNA processing protein RimM
LSSSTELPSVKVGRLGRPHGLDGFIGIYIDEADVPLIQPGATVRVGDHIVRVSDLRRGDKGWQVSFDGWGDRESVEAVRNLELYVAEPRALVEGEYWPEDLIGLEVKPIGGMVIGVEHGPTQDRLVIECSGVTFEVPFVADLVPVVDPEAGHVEIVPIEGLVPDQRLT